MYKKFTYSHTIRRDDEINRQLNMKKQQVQQDRIKQQDDDSEEQFDDLFRIGNKSIIKKQSEDIIKKQIKDEESVNDEESKQNQKKKKKKQKKDKKDKKIKKQKKQRKQYKQKSNKKDKHKKHKDKHKQQYQVISQQDSTPTKNQIKLKQPQIQIQQQNAMQKLQRKMQLLTKYQKQLTSYRNTQQQQNIVNKQFGLKIKINQNTLPIDIIKFGMPQLYTYGIQDRQIPYYKRHYKLNSIIGMRKKKKKMLKLMKQLNIVTNQQNINWSKYQNTSQDRYFHYEGYQKINGIMPQRYYMKNTKNQQQQQIINQQIQINMQNNTQIILHTQHFTPQNIIIHPDIPFNPKQQQIIYLPTNQQKLRTINKQYNIALNANPNNIGLWLKFLDIQDKIVKLNISNNQLQQSVMQKNALIQRKLAIVGKALEKNILNQELGIKYLQLLCDGRKQRRSIQQNIQKLLQAHPDNENIWKFFIQFKLSNIVDFRHSRLQKQYQQINTYLFDKRIKQAKSGKQVWKIRNCGLIILQKILSVHRLQGYLELCTAICCALLEFNIFCGNQMMQFDRKDRLKLFKGYWEDYKVYKLGQYFRVDKNGRNKQLSLGYVENSWQGYIKNRNNNHNNNTLNSSQKQGYISKFLINQNPYKQQTNFNIHINSQWLPSHAQHNKSHILQCPQSFILYQDIQIYIQTFGNIQNWQLLINIVMNNLSMPQIFYNLHKNNSKNNKQNQYIIKWLQNTLINKQLQYKYKCKYHQCYLWGRYWHPLLTHQFLQSNNNNNGGQQINKYIYCINIVQSIYIKLNNIQNIQSKDKSIIRQYILFLYGTVYYLHHQNKQNNNNNIKHILQIFPKQQCQSRIHQLLTEQPNNINLWVIGKSIQQCIQCYLSYIYTINNNINNDNNIIVLDKLGGLYWLSQFIYRNGYHNNIQYNDRNIVLTIMKYILLTQQNPNIQSISQYIKNNYSPMGLSSMQKLLMGNKLKQLLKLFSSSIYNKININLYLYHTQQYKCIIYYMLLQLGQSIPTLIPLILNTYYCSQGNIQMGINILLDFGLLEYENIKQYNILSNNNYVGIKIMGYIGRKILDQCQGRLYGIFSKFKELMWDVRKYANNKKGHNNEENDYYEQPSQNRLYLWLLLMRTLQPQFKTNNFSQIPQQKTQTLSYWQNYNYFTNYFLAIAKKNLINIHQPVCIELLNKLLQSSQYSYQCLNQFPYCRQLYAIAAMDKRQENKEKIYKLVLEKQIRINININV